MKGFDLVGIKNTTLKLVETGQNLIQIHEVPPCLDAILFGKFLPSNEIQQLFYVLDSFRPKQDI